MECDCFLISPSHQPSFPIITHFPGLGILKIAAEFSVLSSPDSHKSLGNYPNSLAHLPLILRGDQENFEDTRCPQFQSKLEALPKAFCSSSSLTTQTL